MCIAAFTSARTRTLPPTREIPVSRTTKKKVRLGALAAMLAFSSSACVIPVGNPLGLPLVTGCNLYILEPGAGAIVVPVIEGLVSVGCDIGLG